MNPALANVPTLDYDQRPLWYRRWRWGRLLLRVLLAAVAVVFLIWGRPITHHVAVLYHQRECLNYSADERQVVFDEHPEAGAVLLAKGDEYQSFVPVHPYSRAAVSHSPRCWDDFQKLAFGAASPRRHVLFLHEVKTKNGDSRLVCVVLNCEGKFDLEGIVLNPGGLATAPSVVVPKPLRIIERPRRHIGSAPHQGYMLFYAGQVYRDDPTRFYITYQLNLEERTIQGRLSDDGTEVKFGYPQDAYAWRADGYWMPAQIQAIQRALQQLPPSQGSSEVPTYGPNRLGPGSRAEFDLPEVRK